MEAICSPETSGDFQRNSFSLHILIKCNGQNALYKIVNIYEF
jgi:hypothetical protein